MSNTWKVFVDSSFIDSWQIDTQLTIVKNSERGLGGAYDFQVFDTMEIDGVAKIHGNYLIGKESSGKWKSKHGGLVAIQSMRQGTTSISVEETYFYFGNLIDHAPVTDSRNLQRPLALVLRSDKTPGGILLSLSWIGESSLTLSAVWQQGDILCVAGFYNPKCLGINVYSSKIDKESPISAQSIQITESAFTHNETTKMLFYVTGNDLHESKPLIQMFVQPDIGLVSKFELPYSDETEGSQAWAFLCLSGSSRSEEL